MTGRPPSRVVLTAVSAAADPVTRAAPGGHAPPEGEAQRPPGAELPCRGGRPAPAVQASGASQSPQGNQAVRVGQVAQTCDGSGAPPVEQIEPLPRTDQLPPGESPAVAGLTLDLAALDRLMPMCLVLDRQGMITHLGPTLAKLAPPDCLGRPLTALGTFRRPYAATTPEEILRPGGRVSLALGTDLPTLRGQAVPHGAGGVLLNLTLGLSMIEEIERRDLTPGDFAPTDLTVELLYMVEAKSAIVREGQRLNARLAEAKKAAEAQALTDTLTGLANRRAMEQVLDELLKLGAGFGLLQLDLDFFKQVNDTLGHAAGDHVLQTVGGLLRGITRPGDTVARTGGDEFLLILPGITDPVQLTAVGERLVEGVAQPIEFEGQPCRVAASVGATASAFYEKPDADRMLSDADEALYASKRSGRSQVSLWRPDL